MSEASDRPKRRTENGSPCKQPTSTNQKQKWLNPSTRLANQDKKRERSMPKSETRTSLVVPLD